DKNSLHRSSFIGKTRWEIPGLTVTDEQWAEHKALLARHEPFHDFEVCRLKPDGQLFWSSVSGVPVFAPDGRFKGYRGISKDITARKLTELELRESEARFRDLSELSSDWYWEQDEHFRFTARSGQALHNVGLSATEGLGKTRWELPYIGVTEQQWDEHKAILRARKTFHNLVLKRLDGSGVLRYFSMSGRPIFDDQGQFTGYRGIGSDVTEQQLRQEALQRFRAAIDASTDGFHIVDFASMRLIDVNETACRTLGYTREEMLLNGMSSFALNYDAAALKKNYERLFTGEDTEQYTEVLYRHRDGALLPIEIHRRGVVIDERRIVVNVVHDITRRKQAEEVLRESEARFRSLTELSSDWYWQQDRDFCFVQVSGSVLQKTGLRETDFFGKTLWDPFFCIDLSPQEWAAHRAMLEAHQPFRDVVYRWPVPNGGMVFYAISGQPYYADDGAFKGYRGIGRDVTERMLAQERIQYLATHDEMTGLPNRVMFGEMLSNVIASAHRYRRSFALLFLDLDRFKNINDTFGHDAGDMLLKEMTKRLTDSLRASDVLVRFGGDEFVVLLQETGNQQQVVAVASKLLAALIKPVVLLGQECRVTASIGISMYPNDAQDAQSLMKNADIAMYRAKEEGRNNYQFYSEHINVHSLERVALESRLRSALERDEFSLHYQAKLDLHTGTVSGVEALLRWQHPELGMVSPAQFIPLAEEAGLIIPIGKWVLKTACAQNMAWQAQGLPSLCMAVNLSPRQFSDNDLLTDIASTLQETGMRPELLELELTEGMVMQSPERAAEVLSKIKALGVRLAIDDFGTGYSSLAHIKRFPIDTLKIDRSFIRDIPHDREGSAITEAIIAMGKTLGLLIVAEGVETEAQQRFLFEHGCNELQGYYFSKPIKAESLAEFLRDHIADPRMKRSIA
ncbi:MAG TPA: EAL domain-containing protein, partial [Burkholderiales bacterium]|nr:EAL domain-containing protein [Burkholderiales bacterium]